jgi:hypothetical protein
MESSNFQNSVPGAPPPPPEVKVRTMKSDLESMARSGGGAPIFQNVAVAGLGAQSSDTSPQAAEVSAPQGSPASGASSKSIIGPLLVVVVAIIALAVVGYFAYTVFSPSANQPQLNTATSTTP